MAASSNKSHGSASSRSSSSSGFPNPSSGSVDRPSHPSAEAPRRTTAVQRKIGRWYLCETLGKGGYSWVKKGRDRKTNRCVALKFMERKKRTTSSGTKQLRQVKTEIEALKHMKNKHVVRLLAYNLSTKYPDAATEKDYESDEHEIKNGVVYKRDVILLVLEYMPGGELFDILYYTSKLNEIVARTYLHQLINGLEACHNASIVHRDLKPQNLLLGRSFNLKITDFGLAKLQESDADVVMETYNVGTRGYQAPEVLLKRPYTSSCDIFSVGVILFILLAGYPPFEHAKQSDRWYSAIAHHDYKAFWRSHKGCGISVPAQDLISRMLRYDSQKRISITQMKQHPWYMAESLDDKNLHKVLRSRHLQMELKRAADPQKKEIMATSARKKPPTGGTGKSPNRPIIPRLVRLCKQLSITPDSPAIELDEEEMGYGLMDVFTLKNYIEVLSVIEHIVVGGCKGKVETDLRNCSLRADLVMMTADPMDPSRSKTNPITFDVNIFFSKKYESNVVKFSRISGPHQSFREFIKYLTWDSIFTGMRLEQSGEVEKELLPDLAKYFPETGEKKPSDEE